MLPASVAIIPDGNRRWARKNGVPAEIGHHHGLINGRCVTQAAFEKGVRHLVVWGASESNLKERTPDEVVNLFRLLKSELRERLRRTDKVRFRLRGGWSEFNKDPDIPPLVEAVERHTEQHQAHQLTVLFGYDGERDNEQAAQKLHDAGVRPTKELIRRHLWTAHLPDIDLIIRTGVEGDPHESDPFLPWQRKNAQLLYSEWCWPDFSETHLRVAFENFAARERRFGS